MRWFSTFAFSAALAIGSEAIPTFEDFSVRDHWTGPNANVKLVRPDERMFRTQLTKAAQEPPNLAGHYRIVGWGCGSLCAAGAIVDLKTGDVYAPPKSVERRGWGRWIFAGGFVDGPYLETRVGSRLVIVRQQTQDAAFQEVRYYEWVGTKFRLIKTRVEKKRN